MDYRGNSLYSGRAHRLFKILGEGTCEALGIEVDLSLPSVRVIAVLEQLCTIFGRPRQLCCANSSEFFEDAMTEWALQHGIHIEYIALGKPNQNANTERLNKSVRTGVCDASAFASLDEVRVASEHCRRAHNSERSH